jgi:hypothetical protein
MRLSRLKSRLASVAALVVLAVLAAAPAASADVGETIIQRCTHGQSLAGFSQGDYRKALKELSADAEEYTDCSSLIRQAQLAAAGGRGGPGGPAAVPLVTTPAEKQAIAHAARAGAAPIKVGNQVIRPGIVHADVASALSSLPAPLLAVIAFLLACLIAVAGGVVRNRIRDGRSD